MNSKYKIVVLISTLLIILSSSITTINYMASLNNTEEQLKNQSLPLSLDNIYTEIQKQIIEPYLVSSMMANDTFVQDWIMNDEKNHIKIEHYLNSIKNKYGMFTTFLVSEKTQNYYTHNGLVEKMKKTNPNNKWYHDFKQIEDKHEINLDFNEHLSNSLIMFINYKIIGKDYSFLGATGVGLKISYIDDMLKSFRQKHHFKVLFIDENGGIALAERKIVKESNIDELKYLKAYKDTLISKESKSIEYEKDGKKYLLSSKYIPELNLYLLVEAKVEDFMTDVKNIFYINLFISLCISILVTVILIFLIRNYNKKLEYLAGNDLLTNMNNRRVFEDKLKNQILLHQRNKMPLSLVFIDIDNFKMINDKYGHEIGDKVLVRIAKILNENIRQTDLVSRWGGEEFIITYIDSSLKDAQSITEKIRVLIENDYLLKDLNKTSVTASFGLTQLKEDDNLDIVISRADKAMYKAKALGKNRIETIN